MFENYVGISHHLKESQKLFIIKKLLEHYNVTSKQKQKFKDIFLTRFWRATRLRSYFLKNNAKIIAKSRKKHFLSKNWNFDL